MIRSFTRRTSVTVALAGAVAFGAVALAPAASAATPVAAAAEAVNGDYIVVDKGNGNGPQAFLITEHGKKPIFFTDPAKPKQRHNNSQPDPEVDGRF